MDKYCILYLVRHGETEANVKELSLGHTDSPLTEKGVSQAKATRERLNGVDFDAVYSSDLGRAVHTASLIAPQHAIKTHPHLRERNYGSFEGLSREVIRNHVGEKPDVENDEALIARSVGIIREIASKNIDNSILVATHGGFMRMLLIGIGYASHNELASGTVSNGAHVKLRCDGEDFIIDEVVGVKNALTMLG